MIKIPVHLLYCSLRRLSYLVMIWLWTQTARPRAWRLG